MINKPKVFLAFSKLLRIIAKSGMSKTEIRNLLVMSCDTDDILVLVDVLDDLMVYKLDNEE